MIFVTGGTGFLGTHLLRTLVKQGLNVRALKRKNSVISLEEESSKKIDWVEGDILDIDSLEKNISIGDEIYHCAGLISFSSRSKYSLMKVNVEGTANMVNVALDKKIKKFLHVSSVSAVRKFNDDRLLNENFEWEEGHLNSNYAISKYLGEREVWRGVGEGLNAVVVNPSIILGAGNWTSDSPGFFLRVWKGLPAYSGGGGGMVAVGDVVQLMIWLMNSQIEGERFILNAENWSYKNLFFLISDLLGKKRPYLNTAPWMMEIFWRLEAIRSLLIQQSPIITKETARTANKTYFFDNAKIRKASGFEFMSIRQCLEETAGKFLDDVRTGKVKNSAKG